MKDRPITKVVIEYKLKDCSECPMVESKLTKGFGHAVDYFCKANNNKMIMGYVEWDSEMKPVPEWCPNKIKE